MKKHAKALLTAGALLVTAFIVGSCSKSHAPLSTVPSVDLERYQGRWYEIARLPQRYEEGCHCVYAEYTLTQEGYVDVLNFCRKGGPDGKAESAKGKAFTVEGSQNSKLKVQFFWPFKGDYWILDLDPDYRHVLVGSPDRESLWILSRTPQLEQSTYRRLVQTAESMGFPVAQLLQTDQSCYQ